MTRFTKALVLAGAAAMVISPMESGAADNAQGATESAADDGMIGLAIGGLLAGGLFIGLLVSGSSKSN